MPTYILGIESSCDDTSASVLCDGKVLSNLVANQEIHKTYGGVVPELASRAHQQNIIPVVNQAITLANIDKNQLNAIAYTRGPGLLGSLLVGSSFSKSLSMGLRVPLIEVNHMQAHLLAHFIEDCNKEKPKFPFLGVTISGGHTQIVLVKDYFEMQVIGETLDDAVGETFDKCGKMMGLSYPAGPIIDKNSKLGNSLKFVFTKPKVEGLNFSFSGLKTAALTLVKKQTDLSDTVRANIAFAFQESITDVLVKKSIKALKITNYKNIIVSGGVGANKRLREKLILHSKNENFKTYFPKLEFCTDNGAMIALAGALRFHLSAKNNYKFSVQPRWKLSDIETTF